MARLCDTELECKYRELQASNYKDLLLISYFCERLDIETRGSIDNIIDAIDTRMESTRLQRKKAIIAAAIMAFGICLCGLFVFILAIAVAI